jgi:hypothetical protein
MATRRTTSDKRQRERAKQAKAAAKRARRQGGAVEGFEEPTPEASTGPSESTEQLIARMESLQEKFDAGQIEFEEFDEQKSELLDKIALSLTA